MSLSARAFALTGGLLCVLSFQNCSEGLLQEELASANSSNLKIQNLQIDGGRITNEQGQSLRFKAGHGTEFQKIEVVSNSGNEVRLKLINTSSARHATVSVILSSSTGRFVEVRKVDKSYMCYEPAKSDCEMVRVPAGIEGAGSLVGNCSSSIAYDGAMVGSIGSLSANINCTGTAAGISRGVIAANVPLSCEDLNPTSIKQMPVDTIEWLAEIFPTGLTRHHHWTIARQLGYMGELGTGGHAAYLQADPARQQAFDNAINAAANTEIAPGLLGRDHYLARRTEGYRGLFICGGANCFLQGECDAYGRAK